MNDHDRIEELLDALPEHLREEDVEGIDPRLLADHRFLDVLLERIHRSDAPTRRGQLEDRITRALGALESAPAPAAERPRILHLWVPAAVAAALLFASLVVWLPVGPSPVTVDDVFARAMAAASDDLDREYRLVTDIRPNPMAPDGMSLEGSLYLQGDSLFVMQFRFQEMEGWGGSNGEEFWVVPGMPQLPVFYSTDSEYFQKALERMNLLSMPWLTIPSVLTNMGEHYDVELVSGPADTAFRMRGTRLGEELRFPDVITFAARRDTGTVEELVLEWGEDHPMGLARVKFTLVAEKRLPADFYDHAAHHAPDRPVRKWTPPGKH